MTRSHELAQARRTRALGMDRRLRELFAKSVSDGPGPGIALVAVGGYGRSELSPASDLDVVLVHDASIGDAIVQEVASAIWYPLWDEGVALDHAVRSTEDMLAAAQSDHRSATGMLDARAVAGDTSLVLALRSSVLAEWRRTARARLPELRAASEERIERAGWLAHAAVPDLKESGGGLRDGVVMRSLVATWLVDVPHGEAEALRSSLLDVRDVLHDVSGRRSDRWTPDLIPDVADILGYEPGELDLHVRDLGRRAAHLASLAWRQVDKTLSAPRRSPAQRTGGPRLTPLARGVAELAGEVVLTADAKPEGDPRLALRAAVQAARHGLPLAPRSAARLADQAGHPGANWSTEMRRSMVDLLASGAGLVPVWEELDLAGIVEQWLPEWLPIRLRGSSSPVHRFTIDRHSIETCVQAAALMRSVGRPDLLVVAALVHDIGKGRPGDHSEIGQGLARNIAVRWGFDAVDADRIAHLVRWHLLLPTVATRRDIEDPATAANVASIVGAAETLDLLAALTEADARATSPTAWSPWRAGLINGLIAKTRDQLDEATANVDPESYEGWPDDAPAPLSAPLGNGGLHIVVARHHAGSLVQISAEDRAGLMADLAGGIALAGLKILSARATTHGGVATTLWESNGEVDHARLELRLRRVLSGGVDLGERLGRSGEASTPATPARIAVLSGFSPTATVFEVRARDRQGLVWAVCRAIAANGGQIRSAHMSTFGPEARDVFYVIDANGESLSADQAEAMSRHIKAVLG